ncbi:hypothetical protein [Candidatus Frankia alpina]|uniref:hypothetical protein n=1 Tax=Candidatus Frankia alpina TaxID=2699483 RepID=UPI001F3604A5|nr:hypothetical protein [Candidatus Frankia alpina]
MVTSPGAARSPWPAEAEVPAGPAAVMTVAAPTAPHGSGVIVGSVPEPVTPGPPGGVLDLAALAAVESRLRAAATAAIEVGVRGGRRSPAAARGEPAGVAAASSIATVLWFDSLRAEDRVSVTPRAGALVHAVHQVLEDARVADDPAGGPAAGGQPTGRPATGGPTPRHPRRTPDPCACWAPAASDRAGRYGRRWPAGTPANASTAPRGDARSA